VGSIDRPWLAEPLGAITDREQPSVAAVDPTLPAVIDAHVHVFPDGLFRAIWRWFDQHGWPIRYKVGSAEVIRLLLDRGIEHLVLLHYAHKPGIARDLNTYVASLCAGEPRVTGLATVLPGEPDAGAILDLAFAQGLKGVKLHSHVQCFAADAPAAREVYEACIRHDRPLVIHAGREPTSPGYKCNTHDICSADRMERVLSDYPKLRVCVPHLGADEVGAYVRMLERFDNLWLDTTMMFADYFPMRLTADVLKVRPDRVMYGTDFPNVPYPWDRELGNIARLDLDDRERRAILAGTARAFFGIPEPKTA
jgi:uncharacterized protein